MMRLKNPFLYTVNNKLLNCSYALIISLNGYNWVSFFFFLCVFFFKGKEKWTNLLSSSESEATKRIEIACEPLGNN